MWAFPKSNTSEISLPEEPQSCECPQTFCRFETDLAAKTADRLQRTDPAWVTARKLHLKSIDTASKTIRPHTKATEWYHRGSDFISLRIGKDAMITGLLKKISRAVTSPENLFRLICLVTGCVTGVYIWAWQTQLRSLLGNSTAVSTALVLVAAMGFAFGYWRRTSTTTPGNRRWLMAGLAHFGLAAWSWGFPLLLQATTAEAKKWGSSLIDSPSQTFLFTVCIATVALGIPAFFLARIWRGLTVASVKDETNLQHQPSSMSWSLLGLGVGLLCGGSLLGPWLGIQSTALTAAAVSGLLGLHSLSKSNSSKQDEQPSVDNNPNSPTQPNLLAWSRQVTVMAALGLLVANWLRMTAQLAITSLETVTIQWAGIAVGMSIGVGVASWLLKRKTTPERIWLSSCTTFTVWAVGLTAAYPLFVEYSLSLSAYQSSLPLLIAGRAGIAWLFFLPLGIVWGMTATTLAPSRVTVVSGVVPFAVGYSCYYWLTVATFGPAVVVLTIACLLWGPIAMCLVARPEISDGVWRRGALACQLAIVLASVIWIGNYDSSLTARVLFSTDIFLAYRSQFNIEELNHFDDSRLQAVVEGDRGTYTLWKRRGSQFQVRHNGLPKAVLASDSSIHPQFSAATLQGLAPLLMHQQPDRVLMLGLGSSASLSTCLHFPISQVVCVEPDAAYLRMMQEQVLSNTVGNPMADDRVQMRLADPAMVALVGNERYDVIISDPQQSCLAASAPFFTSEFYRHISQQLAEGGIFAQRFRYADYGIEPLRVLCRTMQGEFEQVMLMQTAPGEMLALASDAPEGLIRPGILDRVKTPHVRAALAESGWDWSIVLNLSAHTHDQLLELTSEGDPTINSAAGGQFVNRLPREVMRWGEKLQEIAVSLSSRTGRLLDGMDDDANDPDLLQRLAEVNGQQELIRDYPDQYWAYRASVREQVTGGASKRSFIQQVKNQLAQHEMHPNDKRRLRYFKDLGIAARSKSGEDIERVAGYASPYDPLITYFMHEEVAELYSRAGRERVAENELQHRLYTTYFSVAGDRSVRNVVDTIKLLIEEPTAELDSLKRWDHINGQLQILQSRWYDRGSVQPKSFRTMISDISTSLNVTDSAFKAMRQLTADAGIPAAVWDQREQVLKRTLIKPLRDYRAALIPQYEKLKASGRMVKNIVEKNKAPANGNETQPVKQANHAE